jgi:putative DNA primase/helicase
VSEFDELLDWAKAHGFINGNGNGHDEETIDLSFLYTLPFTDLGNAERLVALHGKDLRYSYQLKQWHAWDGKRWQQDQAGEIYRRASNTVRQMYAEAGRLEGKAAMLPDDQEEEREKLAKMAEKLSEFARRSEAKARIEAMVGLAQSREGIPVMLHSLDSDPWLLNVNNGTLNLRTGELHPHNMITKLAPVDYDPDAAFQLWDDFINYILPDEERQSFVQRAAGYTLCGENSEEKLFFAFGPTATGKSTFLKALRSVLGDYAAVADFATFLEKSKQGGGPSNDIARLAGKRFVVSIEVEQGQKLAESLVQTITGGDPIAARFMYTEFFEFVPTFTLWMAANNRPRVRDDNDANWRRIVQIPFDVQIKEEDRDESVKKHLSDPDIAGPAILAWLVKGCMDWQEKGLQIPEIVKETTRAYREEMNPLAEFLEECCLLLPTARAGNTEIWDAYQKWAREGHMKFPLGRKSFSQRLEALDGVEKVNSGGRFWTGIGLLADIPD